MAMEDQYIRCRCAAVAAEYGASACTCLPCPCIACSDPWPGSEYLCARDLHRAKAAAAQVARILLNQSPL